MRQKFKDFSRTSEKILNRAIKLAKNERCSGVNTEHVLLALLENDQCAAANLLLKRGVTPAQLCCKRPGCAIERKNWGFPFQGLLPETLKMLDLAVAGAHSTGVRLACPENILSAMLESSDCAAFVLLKKTTVDIAQLTKEARQLSGQAVICNFVQNKPALSIGKSSRNMEKYGKDLTRLAADGKLDPVLCREKELERIVTILCRRQKNNPCLVGEPGVGKTALAEALAQKIAQGDVPGLLMGKRVLSLDITSMVAGTKYRGDFEEKFKTFLDEIIKDNNTIVFMDEIHLIAGAGAAEGAVDAAGILKPMLSRGEIHLIGATTHKEYQKLIQKEPALERRFCMVNIEEPEDRQAIEILKGLAPKYERYHGLKISCDAICEAVILSKRYMPSLFLPDKAIDLIDEAAAEKQLASGSEQYGLSGILGPENIRRTTARITGVPMERINEQECIRMAMLEKRLQRSVKGQRAAVKAVSEAIIRSRTGLHDSDRPIGGMLFLGPTGVGKTFLAKQVARHWFGTEKALIRFDMSEYMERHAVSKLIGAPPGYQGFEEGGRLTNAVRARPYSVLLFDEIEKAHPDMQNLLLQILEEGELTDSQGNEVNFKNCLILLTSNLGAEFFDHKKSKVGFCAEDRIQQNAIKEKAIEKAKTFFRPEVIGRLDEIIVFNQLNQQALIEIANQLLNDLEERAQLAGYKLRHLPEVPRFFANEQANRYGARELRKNITQRIEQVLAEKIVYGQMDKGRPLLITAENDKIQIQQEIAIKKTAAVS